MITKEAVLRRIANHDGEWGWYQLERFINPCELAPGKTVMTLVKELRQEGLILEVPAEPMPKYKLTDKGRAHLENNPSEDDTTLA